MDAVVENLVPEPQHSFRNTGRGIDTVLSARLLQGNCTEENASLTKDFSRRSDKSLPRHALARQTVNIALANSQDT